MFQFFKKKNTAKKLTMPVKEAIDQLYIELHKTLKPLGFVKNGRHFNRRIDNNIVQIINIQTGQYPIGENYEVPGLRENLYGYFCINLSIIVDDFYEFQNGGKKKKYLEYDGLLRKRLGILTEGKDEWWAVIDDSEYLSEFIVKKLELAAFPWFQNLNNVNKIISYLSEEKNLSAPVDKLNRELLKWLYKKEGWETGIRNYLDAIEHSKNNHKKYVIGILKSKGIPF